MARATEKKIKVFHLGRPEQREEYEALLNSDRLHHIEKDEFTYSKRTEQPIITVWYEVYLK